MSDKPCAAPYGIDIRAEKPSPLGKVDRREAARRMRSGSYGDTLYVFDLIRLTAFGTFPKGEGQGCAATAPIARPLLP